MESKESQNPEIVALLKVLELGEKQIEEGKVKSMDEVFSRLKFND